MKQQLMLIWQQILRRLGLLGVAAVALVLAAVLIATSIPGLYRQGEQLHTALGVKTLTTARANPALLRRVPVGEQVREFVDAFPLLTQSPDDLNEVFQSAKRRDLTLLKGEYQLKQDPQAPLMTYTVTLPVKSQYSAIKAFTTDVLLALPHASMDELRMTRNDASGVMLETVIRFTFVYRSI